MIAIATGTATIFSSVLMGGICAVFPHPLVLGLMAAGIGVMAWVTVEDAYDAIRAARRAAEEEATARRVAATEAWDRENAAHAESVRRHVAEELTRARGRRLWN